MRGQACQAWVMAPSLAHPLAEVLVHRDRGFVRLFVPHCRQFEVMSFELSDIVRPLKSGMECRSRARHAAFIYGMEK